MEKKHHIVILSGMTYNKYIGFIIFCHILSDFLIIGKNESRVYLFVHILIISKFYTVNLL